MPAFHMMHVLESNVAFCMTVKIIAHQWYWRFDYADWNVQVDSFLSPKGRNALRLLDTDTALVLPCYCSIRLALTSSDVLHSFAVPNFAIKSDCCPGRINIVHSIPTVNGVYFGQCSEICGAQHAFMPIRLEVCSTTMFLNHIM